MFGTQISSSSSILLIGLAITLVILIVPIYLVTRLSFRIIHATPPLFTKVLSVSALQCLLGGLAIFILWWLNNSQTHRVRIEPGLAFALGMIVILLSALGLMRWIFRLGWKQILPIWGIASSIELVVVPICTLILLIALINLLLLFFPPVANGIPVY